MGVSKTIKAVLSMRGIKQSDLQGVLNMGSKQSLSNKFTHERWSAVDLIKIAEVCGCEIAFLLPDGQKFVISGEGSEK